MENHQPMKIIREDKRNKGYAALPEKFTWWMHRFYMPIIALNTNRLNSPTKTLKLAKWVTIKLNDNNT